MGPESHRAHLVAGDKDLECVHALRRNHDQVQWKGHRRRDVVTGFRVTQLNLERALRLKDRFVPVLQTQPRLQTRVETLRGYTVSR